MTNVEAVTEALAVWDSERDLDDSLIDITPMVEAARAYVNATEFDAPHTVDVPGHYLLIKVD